MNYVMNTAKGFLNLIYPLRCAICSMPLSYAQQEAICFFCAGKIKKHPKPYCRICGRTIDHYGDICLDCIARRPSFKMARSACLYEDSMRELIHLFKYNSKRHVSGILAKHMIALIKDQKEIIENIDAITFVPMHKKRFAHRGFNQSEVLALKVSHEIGIPIMKCIEKRVVTKHQNELSRQERLRNLKDVFKICPGMNSALKGKRLLVIDDVMTTGTTLNECSYVLLEAGASEVRCLTVARGS